MAFNRLGAIHKLRRQDFEDFWTPLPLRRQVYYISLCSSIDIWQTPPPPHALVYVVCVWPLMVSVTYTILIFRENNAKKNQIFKHIFSVKLLHWDLILYRISPKIARFSNFTLTTRMTDLYKVDYRWKFNTK